ncbi:TadE/TadG family type IV pilus assembly protein [Alsobacter sp. R-9]
MLLRLFREHEKGTVLTAFGVMAIPIGMVVGGAVDFTRVIQYRTQMQARTDAAALAAAQSLSTDKTAVAQRYVGDLAFPMTLTATVDGNKVTVSVASTVPSPFLSIVGTKGMEARTKATAEKLKDGPPACLLALNPTVSGAISFSGSSSTIALGCAVYSNSSSDSAISVSGSASVKADGFCSVGGFAGPSNMQPEPQKRCLPAEDPYAKKTAPTASGCDYNNYSVQPKKNVKLNPGTYCGGLDIKGDAQLQPGTYIIKDGPLQISSQSNVSGSEVLFVLTGKSAGFTINGGASIDLKASTSGNYANILIFQDKNSNVGAGNTINGDSNTKLQGGIYTPTQTVTLNGSGSFGQSNVYMPVVADQIKLTGNATTQADVTKLSTPADVARLRNAVRLVN